MVMKEVHFVRIRHKGIVTINAITKFSIINMNK